LLANIYLHQFDEWYSRRYGTPDRKDRKAYHRWYNQRKPGMATAATQMFRYADDWIILVRGTQEQARQVKEECKCFLQEELGLELSEEKTKITHIEDGFDFLGFHIFRSTHLADRRVIGVFIQPPEKGLKNIKLKVKAMTKRNTLNDDYLLKIQAINQVVRGWATYYRAVNPTTVFQELDRYVWLRLRKWLEKKHQLGPQQVRRQYMYRQKGPKGGTVEFAAQDENSKWVWRYRATQTKLIYYHPTYKRNWPNPYLEQVQVEHYELPTLKTLWSGYHEAPAYVANRRKVIQRAQGRCERCGRAVKLTAHHKHRVKRGKRKLEQADNRPEMLEALCRQCQDREHRAERIYRIKARTRKKPLAG
jgi:5-methylcytosine-specific restriction endonuclease McrA